MPEELHFRTRGALGQTGSLQVFESDRIRAVAVLGRCQMRLVEPEAQEEYRPTAQPTEHEPQARASASQGGGMGLVMAENDWFGFSRRTKLYLDGVVGLLGGTFWTGASLVGYDLGRRVYGPGIPYESRWTGRLDWLQLAIGVAMLAYGLWRLRLGRAE